MARAVVTAGYAYADIDAFAGIIAYAELLRAQGQDAIAVSHAPLNESILPEQVSLASQFSTKYDPQPDDQFVLVDFSDPLFLEDFVDIDKVTEVIDHHVGFEKLWQERIGNKANIEFIGAACTLVYEAWQKAGVLQQMQPGTAELLAAGILDNTLNFGAKVTMQRDHDAYKELIRICGKDEHWPGVYFNACQQQIEKDVPTAVQNDHKIWTFTGLTGETCFGQLVLWDSEAFLRKEKDVLVDELAAKRPQWFMNLIDLKEGCSYFMADKHEIKEWLSRLLGVEFEDNIAKADRMWLRKEVIKKDLHEEDNTK